MTASEVFAQIKTGDMDEAEFAYWCGLERVKAYDKGYSDGSSDGYDEGYSSGQEDK